MYWYGVVKMVCVDGVLFVMGVGVFDDVIDVNVVEYY